MQRLKDLGVGIVLSILIFGVCTGLMVLVDRGLGAQAYIAPPYYPRAPEVCETWLVVTPPASGEHSFRLAEIAAVKHHDVNVRVYLGYRDETFTFETAGPAEAHALYAQIMTQIRELEACGKE